MLLSMTLGLELGLNFPSSRMSAPTYRAFLLMMNLRISLENLSRLLRQILRHFVNAITDKLAKNDQARQN